MHNSEMEKVKEEDLPVEKSITGKCTEFSTVDQPESPNEDVTGKAHIAVDPNHISERDILTYDEDDEIPVVNVTVEEDLSLMNDPESCPVLQEDTEEEHKFIQSTINASLFTCPKRSQLKDIFPSIPCNQKRACLLTIEFIPAICHLERLLKDSGFPIQRQNKPFSVQFVLPSSPLDQLVQLQIL